MKYGFSLGARVFQGSTMAASLLALAITIAGVSPARAAGVTSCPSSITSCGCTITDATVHTVANDLNAGQGLTAMGDCIDIKTSMATLEVANFDIDGSGSGIGVRILSSAKRATVQNWKNINGWAVGIEDDGAGALISSCGSCNLNNNSTAGLLLNKVKGSTATGFDISNNGTGVVVNGGSGNQLDALDVPDCSASANHTGISLIGTKGNMIQDSCVGCCSGHGNTADGVDLTNSSNNSMVDLGTSYNGGDGLSLVNSKNNSFDDSTSQHNVGSGVKLTQSSNNFIGDDSVHNNGARGIVLDPGSNNNSLYDSSFNSNTGNGIEIGAGNTSNNIFFNSATGNATDLVDGNAGCDKNIWTNNCFSTKSQSCIGNQGLIC